MFSGQVAKSARFFIFAVGKQSKGNFFYAMTGPVAKCKTYHNLTRPRCEIWTVFYANPGFGRFLAILDTFGRKWYNLSSGRKYGLKTKIRPK